MERADEEVPDHIPIHGYMFQLKLLVLFMCRGLTGGYSFNLGTEIKEAGKFDDLVFEFTLDRKKYFRLLQAKHKLDKTGSSITTNSLLNKIKSEFYLPKYFFSYLDAKNNSMFRGGTIKDVIICTNVNFNDKVLNNEDIKIQLLSNKDDLLDINMSCLTKPMRYKFTEEIVPKLNKILNDYKTKSKKVLSDYNDDDIKDFINHLVFAVDCPSEQELDEVIKREIEKQFNFLSNIFSVQNTYCRFMMTMLDWLQGKVRGRFISGEEGKQFFEEARKSIPVLFNIRGPVESFTGRNKELENLHKLLKISSDKTKVVCVTGIGGIGKTELARMYISNFAMEYNNNVLWFNAGSYQALEACFRSLASDKLGISTKNANGKDRGLISIVEDVYKTISNRKCLIIFDNVQHYQCKNECDDGIDRFLPSFSEVSGPYILITSRNQNWPSTIHVLSLDTFEKDEAVQFISKALKTDSNESSILADQMQCFPLALQQAVSYIKVQNMKLQNVGSHFNIACYLNLLKDKSKLVLNYSFPDESYIDYTQTVYITWNVTLDLIRKSENGNEALKIMNILSYMDPEDIPIEIFLKLVNDYDVLSSALGILKQYSMITIHHKIISSEQQVGMINVHVLVQEVIRLKLVEDKEDRLILEEALQIFTRKNVNDRTLNHAMSVWDYSSKVDFFSEDIRRYCVWVSIYICSELLVNSRFMELNSFVQKAIESCNLLPKDDIIAQGCLLHLIHIKGGVLRILGKCKDSEESFQNVASHIETVYSKTLSLINKRDSAMTLIKQGNYNEAINILKETKTLLSPSVSSDSEEFLENVFDLEGKYECLYQSLNFSKEDDFIKTIDLGKKNIIALLYFQQGKYTEALKEFKELVDIGRNVLGENHPKILWFQTNIAKILREQAKLDEALKLLEEIYEKQKTVLGKDHLDTLETLFCKGEILEDQEKFNDSLRIYQEVLENRITKLGKDHQSSLKACTSIGNIFYKLKDYDKALEKYNEVLSKSDNLDIIIKIGEIYFNKGEINRALVIFEDAMKVIQDKFGCDHYTYLFVSTHIAELYQKQGKYDLALEHYQNIFEIKKNELGENHPDCLFIKYNIAITLFLKKELNKSLEMSCELLGKMNGILGADHPQSLSVRNNISAILVLQDRLDEALQECKASIEIQKLNPERNGRNITVTKKILVDIFSKQNKHEEVLKLLTETLENQESVSHNNPLTIGDTKSEIALCLIRLNKPQRAIKFVRESFNIFKSVLGPEHPKTVIQSDLLQYLSPHCLFAAVTQNKTTEFIKELVTSGCDFDIQDDEGRTLLHHAVNQGNIETVKYLLSIGVDVTQVTEKGNSCLHVAVLKGNRDVVKVLLQYSSHFRLKEFIDIRTNLRGMAALHVASINDNLDLVRTLLNHGAKYNILNNDTKRPIDLAKDKEVKSILKLVEINFNLVSWGSIKADELNALKEEDLVAMVNARNENGQTLLQHAISKSDKISAQRLLEILQKMKVI